MRTWSQPHPVRHNQHVHKLRPLRAVKHASSAQYKASIIQLSTRCPLPLFQHLRHAPGCTQGVCTSLGLTCLLLAKFFSYSASMFRGRTGCCHIDGNGRHNKTALCLVCTSSGVINNALFCSVSTPQPQLSACYRLKGCCCHRGCWRCVFPGRPRRGQAAACPSLRIGRRGRGREFVAKSRSIKGADASTVLQAATVVSARTQDTCIARRIPV